MKTILYNVKIVSACLLIYTGFLPVSCSGTEPNKEVPDEPVVYPEVVENYNYILGAQTIGPAYKFTPDTKLVETAKQILLMGSNILKISLALDVYDLSGQSYNFSYELFEKYTSFNEILSMDFKYYFFWVYTPKVNTGFGDGLSTQESQDEYENLYKLAEYLLKTCNGTGKAFYIGHWEGDWHLTAMDGNKQTIEPNTIQGMTDWYNIRQKAIEDAKAANTGSDVKVYQYCEVNRVFDALNRGYERVVNKVLPYSDVDFVSFSSYDAIYNGNYTNLEREMHGALNYIEQNMKPKPGITGKRVFIGEYGFAGREGAQTQNNRAKMVMKAALKWGCPFILYWEMYNNEIDNNGNQTGYWLINDKGVKQPVYYTHNNFYKAMKKYVYDYNTENGHLPSQAEYLENAVKFFE